jgi:hypothetical protein
MLNVLSRHLTSAAFAAVCLSPSFAMAHASFEDHAVTIEYGLDLGLGAGFQALQSFVVTVGDTIEIPEIRLNASGTSSWSVDVFDTGFVFTYSGSVDFMNFGSPEFIGFRVSDAGNVLEPIKAVSIGNTAYVSGQRGNLIEGFEPSLHLAHDEDTFWLNLNESMYHHVAMPGMGDPFRDQIRVAVVFEHDVSPPVPEPQTWAMLLAGLGLTACAMRRAAGRV